MKLPSFFKTPSHRVFDFKPRYYNPAQEKYNTAPKSEGEYSEAELSKARIQRQYAMRKTRMASHDGGKSLLRIAIIASILMFLIYLIFV